MARFENKDLQTDNLVDKLIAINRVSKTVKGGRTMSFSALVVVGDKAGKVGFGKGHAREVQSAVQKATKEAKRKMVQVPLKEGRTLHHDISAKFGAGQVVMRAAVPGTGIIAGGALRAVFDCLGVQDVVAKSKGSNNPHNMVRAAFLAFGRMNSPKIVANRRGKPVAEIVSNQGGRMAAKKEEVVE
ncbi:MAG: 30S ribosomal protein S5 [Rickettsiales bacterium]|jgi:small subunit ribosomal protein S5|nr:30S ribosomal protein S5 [Rickettsiales bacterium]